MDDELTAKNSVTSLLDHAIFMTVCIARRQAGRDVTLARQ
jgi:hypothetical protein